MSTRSRGNYLKRLPKSLFCLLIVINYAKATIDYAAFRNDKISEQTKRESARTTRTIVEEVIQRNITSEDDLQHGTEHLLQYGAFLRTEILDTFGKLVYDNYDNFGMSQIESLYKVYRETLERKYNIFDIVPSVLEESDTRPNKICAYINKHVKSCLKESSKVCMNINIQEVHNEDNFSKTALNETRRIYELSEISINYPNGFSPEAVLKYLKSGRLGFTPSMFSGLLHNVQYDNFDDKVRTAERELIFFLTRTSRKFPKEIEKVSTSSRSVNELLRNYLTSGSKIFDERAQRHANYLAEHVIREIDAISQNIEWLGTVYDNSTINLKYLFELILPNDTMDRDIIDARNYLLHQIKDNMIVENYLRIEKYQQAGPDQLFMEILGQLRDINFAEDVVNSLYTHARFWHKSQMIENLDELLELFDAYENLRGIPNYRELLLSADRIKSYLVHSKNVSIELLCSRPRSCLRIGLEMIKSCSAIDEKTKVAINIFTNSNCQCSSFNDDSVLRITQNNTKLDEEEIEQSTVESSTLEDIEISGLTTEKGLTVGPLETNSLTGENEKLGTGINDNETMTTTDSSTDENEKLATDINDNETITTTNPVTDENEKLGTGINDDETLTTTISPILEISTEGQPEKSTKNTSESLDTKLCMKNCSSSLCNVSDCQSQENSTYIQCEGSVCDETDCKEANCTTSSNELNSSKSDSCDGDDCENNSSNQSDCEGPDCPLINCQGDSCQANFVTDSIDPSICEGPECDNTNFTKSICKSPNCKDNTTSPGLCNGPDCRQDDVQVNWTVSTENTICPGPDCLSGSCIGDNCQVNLTQCKGSNCSDVSCRLGDCQDGSDDSNDCEGSGCPDGSQLTKTAPITTCEGPNCTSIESLDHCEGSECSTEPEVECKEGECSKERKDEKPEGIGCHGTNCTRKDCEGPDCLITSVVDCQEPNCTNFNCTGPNCDKESGSQCEGLDCFDNNCTNSNCSENSTIEDCQSFNCLNDPTANCNGSDCQKIEDESTTNCTGYECSSVPSDERNNCKNGNCSSSNCDGENCDDVTTEKIASNSSIADENGDECQGENCKNETKKLCEGPDCLPEVNLTSEDEINNEPCTFDNCTTDSLKLENNCEGENCEGNSTKKGLNVIKIEENCEGEDCGKNGTIYCKDGPCTDEFFEEKGDRITEEPCLSDNCTTLSPTSEFECEGVNCESNSTEITVENIENKENCESGKCEGNLKKKNCEGEDCIDKLSERENGRNIEDKCNFGNCTLSPFSSVREIEENTVSTAPLAGVTSTVPTFKPSSTFCGNRDPHYRRRRNRLRKMRRIDALISSWKYRGGNDTIISSVLEGILKKVNEDSNVDLNKNSNIDINKNSNIDMNKNSNIDINKNSNIDMNKNSNIDINKNSNIDINKNSNIDMNKNSNIDINKNLTINLNSVDLIGRKFDAKDQITNPLLQVLGHAKSIYHYYKTKKNKEHNGRKSAQFSEINDDTINYSGLEENSKNSLSLNQTTIEIDNSKINNSDQVANEENDEEMNSRNMIRQKRIELENQLEKLKIIERAYSKASNSNKLDQKDIRNKDRQRSNSKQTKKVSMKKKFQTNWHNFKMKVNKNHNKNESVSDDETSNEQELKKKARTDSSASQKEWKIIQRKGSTKSRVKTKKIEESEYEKMKQKLKTASDEMNILRKDKHKRKKNRTNHSVKHEEQRTEKDIQNDLENLENGWKILKRGKKKNSNLQTTVEKKIKGKTKRKLKFHKRWNKSERKNSTMKKEVAGENKSPGHEDLVSLEEILTQRKVAKSKSKMTHDSGKIPTQWLEKQRKVRRKFRSRDGHTWKEKSSRGKKTWESSNVADSHEDVAEE